MGIGGRADAIPKKINDRERRPVVPCTKETP